MVRQGKKATHKCSLAEGGFSGPSKVQGPVSKPNSVGCYRQLNSSSPHKQTRRNPLGGDVRSPVKDHDLVPSLPDNIKSQTHPRVSECDGRPSVQVEPRPVNRMVTASAGVQTDLSQVVHSSCRSFCHSPEPQSSTIRVSSPRPKCLGHRCPWDMDALVLGPSAALNRDPTSTSSVKQSHNYMFHSNLQHLNLHAWCLGADSSKNKASLWRWQRKLLPLRDRRQGPFISQSGPYLRNGAEKIWWISPLPL